MKIYVEKNGKIIFNSSENINPNTIEEAQMLIDSLKYNIIFLKGIICEIKETAEKDKKIIPKFNVYKSDLINIDPVCFGHGLCQWDFDLGRQFNKDTSKSIRFISSEDIYYENSLVIKKNTPIPYYKQMLRPDDLIYVDNKVTLILDLRPPGVYGHDFDYKKLSNKNGPNVFEVKGFIEYLYL